MADTFYREPTDHGDSFIWGPFILLNLRCGGRGGLSMELLNTGGALHLSAGYCGLNDGVVQGVVERTADQALSIATISVHNWASVEASVSGSAVTYHVEDIAGASALNGEWTIPAAVKAAYDYLKGGYYLVASRRLLGVFFKRSDGVLGRVINCESGKSGFKKIAVAEYIDNTGARSTRLVAKRTFQLGDWNMDTTQYYIATFSYYGGVFSAPPPGKIINWNIRIRDDIGVWYDFMLGAGPSSFIIEGSYFYLERLTGGRFDNASFVSTGFSRGEIVIEYET